MALRIELKPVERIIVGTSVITNDDQRTRLTIEGEAPILREKDILTARTADSAAKRIYLAVQLMYLGQSGKPLLADYTTLMRDFLAAAPSSAPLLANIDNAVLTAEFYKGLRAAQRLIAFERELLDHAAGSTRLRGDGAEDGEPA